ncbi:MAG: protein kinase [Myxococcales bacterium]|nr:protein kinase [Myxococcales bacterium]
MKHPSSLVLYQLARGTLDAKRRAEVEAHLARCRECQAQSQQVGALAGADLPPAASLADALEPRHDQAPTRSLEASSTGPVEGQTRVLREPHAAGDSVTLMRDSGSLDGLDDSFGDDLGTSSASGWSSTMHAELPRGTPIGRYLVVEPLGSGGLGDVYTAYDPDLDRCVAVKVLRPSPDDPEDATTGGDRLMREAKALARLAHPNVVAVHDVGRVGQDVFIAMERVEGKTLSQWYRSERHGWRQIRDVFLGVGAGVAAAHDAGIIHRDLKPQNVIVSPDGRPRVLDFGLARAVRRDERSGLMSLPRAIGFDPRSSQDSLEESITMAGMVMGTPQYMAPEQFEGSERTGPASDQFSFCVALWVALYDQRPFQGDGIPALIRAVRSGQLTEPSDRRGVPGWLHKVMLRGLSTDPQQRYPSMHALLHDMQRDHRSRRAQWIALGSVGLVSAVVAAAAAIWLRPPVTEEHRDGIEQLATEARAAAARSFYVYPDPSDDSGVTAYRKVLELEQQEGPAEELADERAHELREEFSETLSRLGDRYYEREGGRAFAADYYAAALIFDPDNSRARDRTLLTPGELASLRDKAARGEFSPAELAAAASLSVLATDDEAERRSRLTALYSGDSAPSVSTSALLQALLDDEDAEVIAQATTPRRAAGRPQPEPEPEPEPESPFLPVTHDSPESPFLPVSHDSPETDTAAAGESGAGDAEPVEVEPDKPIKRNPQRAKALAKQGREAFKRGDFSQSEALYHQALAHDRRNADALGGLAELYFERGSYQKAVQFASKAVGVAPRRAKYRIVLGDAYFKTLAYQSARREYQKAANLGHPSAAGRLTQLDKQLGG